ncbi:hypothetical protein [Eikenella corrodens]|uniref:hypothetical protein n=1 Tax=Eikenella corrodens TaxID=539 RepID=UPI00129AF0F8|nr:hypothetical protein [Eikenella corrodens]
MKIGFRTPSLKRRIAARTSLKRMVRHKLGIKMPRGLGVVSDPKRAMYNKIYHRTTIPAEQAAQKGLPMLLLIFAPLIWLMLFVWYLVAESIQAFRNRQS